MTPDRPVATSGIPAEPDTALRRAISGELLYLFILGDVLGAGIYALVGQMAEKAGGMIWLPLAFALLLALLTAASYAELVTKYPRAGGAAVFAHREYRTHTVATDSAMLFPSIDATASRGPGPLYHWPVR